MRFLPTVAMRWSSLLRTLSPADTKAMTAAVPMTTQAGQDRSTLLYEQRAQGDTNCAAKIHGLPNDIIGASSTNTSQTRMVTVPCRQSHQAPPTGDLLPGRGARTA